MLIIINLTDCPYRIYKQGIRSYGSNIPTNCQGQYFPGDEPGEYCSQLDELCDLSVQIDKCPRFEETKYTCPDCEECILYFDEVDEIYMCFDCGEEYNLQDLQNRFKFKIAASLDKKLKNDENV